MELCRLDPHERGLQAIVSLRAGKDFPDGKELCVAIMRLESAELAPHIWCIRVHGEVDSSNLDRLKSAFDQIFAKKIYRVVINLEQTKYVASSGIGCLIGGFTTAIKNGGRIVFAATPLQVMEVLNLIGLGQILRFAKDEKSALEQFA